MVETMNWSRELWQSQEFMAHDANVNCLSLGHKSGRVLVTGGDDKKVNLWAVGKTNCIMSLSGHSSPVDCVQFNATEELVCAGSQMGVIKIWDLEAAKLVRTLTGHRGAVKCVDFHPYGDFLASGSTDNSIKLWDSRKKDCIFKYTGHRLAVNSLKFSPDGQWIASGGEEGVVKMWDLRMGRVLHEFHDHTNSITSVKFHPHEFLLASGSLDRTVNFWDLESFQLVSTEKHVGIVRIITFNTTGECLYAGSTDSLRVIAWEPARTLCTMHVGWNRVQDIAATQNQLIGASFHTTNVTLYLTSITRIKTLSNEDFNATVSISIKSNATIESGDGVATSPRHSTSPFARNSLRRSFSKDKSVLDIPVKQSPFIKTIEESNTSGTEEDFTSQIPNIHDYTEVFKPNKNLPRTPPPPEDFENDNDVTSIKFPSPTSEPEYLSLNNIDKPTTSSVNHTHSLELSDRTQFPTLTPISTKTNNLNRSVSNLENTYKNRVRKKTEPLNIPKLKINYDVIESRTKNRGKLDGFEVGRAKLNSFAEPSSPTKCVASNPTSPIVESRNFSLNNRAGNLVGSPRINSELNLSGLKHSASELNIHRVASNSRSHPLGNHNSRSNGEPSSRSVKIPTNYKRSTNERSTKCSAPVDIYVKDDKLMSKSGGIRATDKDNVNFVPAPIDKPVGLDFSDFLPKSRSLLSNGSAMTNMSEAEVLGSIMRGHEPMMSVLENRTRSLKIFYQIWHNRSIKHALDHAMALNDHSVLVDVLPIMSGKTSLWNLDVCVLLLPKISELLQSKYETYMQVGCNVLRLILKNFSSVIKMNVQSPCGTLGVDIPREERYKKCKSCHDSLLAIRAFLLKRQTVQGTLGTTFRDLHKLLEVFD